MSEAERLPPESLPTESLPPESLPPESLPPESLPWGRLMGLAFARLHWTPETFWAATPQELYAGLEELSGDSRRRDFAALRRAIEEKEGHDRD